MRYSTINNVHCQLKQSTATYTANKNIQQRRGVTPREIPLVVLQAAPFDQPTLTTTNKKSLLLGPRGRFCLSAPPPFHPHLSSRLSSNVIRKWFQISGKDARVRYRHMAKIVDQRPNIFTTSPFHQYNKIGLTYVWSAIRGCIYCVGTRCSVPCASGISYFVKSHRQ